MIDRATIDYWLQLARQNEANRRELLAQSQRIGLGRIANALYDAAECIMQANIALQDAGNLAMREEEEAQP